MTKKERRSRLKEIIAVIDTTIKSLKGNYVLEEAETRIKDLETYLEEHCIMPDTFDADELIQSMLIGYLQYDDEVNEIEGLIEELEEEVADRISEMREGVAKEEWEEFHSNLEVAKETIDLTQEEIDSLECFIERLEDLKTSLEDLF